MNDKMIEEINKASKEIDDAGMELSLAAQEYEKRRKIAQTKLTHASGRLSSLMSVHASMAKP